MRVYFPSMAVGALILTGSWSRAEDQKTGQSAPVLREAQAPGHARPLDDEAQASRKGAPQLAPPLAAGGMGGFVGGYPLWVNLQALMNDGRMSHVEPTVRRAIDVDFGRLRDKRSQLLPEAAALDSDDDALVAVAGRLVEEKRGLDSELADLTRQINDHNARCNPAPDEASYRQCVSDSARLNSWRDQYNNKSADFNVRRGNYGARQDRLKEAWAGFLQTVEGWGTEIQVLIDRVLKELNKTDTGDCTAEQHRKLQDEVDRACKRPRACTGNMECPELRENLQKNQECFDARKAINDTCYKGGNEGHKQALSEAQNAINNCIALIAKRCGAAIN